MGSLEPSVSQSVIMCSLKQMKASLESVCHMQISPRTELELIFKKLREKLVS